MENQDSGTGRIRAHYKVLLVEDNPTLQMVQKTFLEMTGCEVEITDKGREALTLTQANTYDCVFLDLGLPDVKDGRDVLLAIRAREQGTQQHLPIVVITAHGKEILQDCLDKGADAALMKPVHPDQWAALVQQFCKREDR
ncbi:response regulator [Candidatus Glomeribacter gigasporarum]|uniref:response regulator n=1 Tax=Candidatus Glomeribacter gigasporarum TaxID=132144 RepID=UPI00030AD7B4|nr:response regulator [Candidatus Glomeribacter gigasporarum]